LSSRNRQLWYQLGLRHVEHLRRMLQHRRQLQLPDGLHAGQADEPKGGPMDMRTRS
jgi:hypothetical protein